MVKKMPDRDLAYFRDDQLLFLVTYPENITSMDLENFQSEISGYLQDRSIVILPRAFSFPATVVDAPEQRRSELHDSEVQARKKELAKRMKELQVLKSQLSDKDWKELPHKLKEIKNSAKKGDDWLDLLVAEINKREDLLRAEEENLAVAQPKLFDTPFSVLLCELNKPGPNEQFIPLLETIQALRKTLSESPSNGAIKIEDVSPNWLMSVSSQGGATGGPGALPMPFNPAKDGSPMYGFYELIEKLKEKGLYNEGENVDVAILDTVPCAHDLVLALKEWKDHPLVQGLLGPSGKLIPYHATYTTLQRMASTSVNQHDYPMADHGLFAAGIVHSIVPQAKIHLIEVLNEFGVGDLASLAEGLALVYNQIHDPKSGRRLVVNCSWMLELPPTDLHCIASEGDANREEYEFEQAILEYVRAERDHALNLRNICNQLALAGRQIVAAAGNDKLSAIKVRERKLRKLLDGVTSETVGIWIDYLLEHNRNGAPEARYPAAFVSVIGVGALPKTPQVDGDTGKYVPSNYSNLGDRPAGEAVMTLGGEEGVDNQQRNKGVLGLYLGKEFPRVAKDPMPGHPHKREISMYRADRDTPLAWWAGTSFAAPIVTGAIAAALGTGRIQRTQEAFEALKTTDIIKQAGTINNEDVMEVKQG